MFEIIEKLFSHEDGAEYTGYGIRCENTVLHNITHDLNSIRELVRRLEEGEFLPEHLEDVVEDWIAD